VSRALPRPLRARGAKTERWERWHARSRRVVFGRVLRNRGRCEAPGCQAQATEWCHLVGRGNLVAEPFTSLPELTAGLCRDHHNAIDRHLDDDLRRALTRRGYEWLVEWYEVRTPAEDAGDDPLDLVREYVRRMELEWKWDADRLELARAA